MCRSAAKTLLACFRFRLQRCTRNTKPRNPAPSDPATRQPSNSVPSDLATQHPATLQPSTLHPTPSVFGGQSPAFRRQMPEIPQIATSTPAIARIVSQSSRNRADSSRSAGFFPEGEGRGVAFLRKPGIECEKPGNAGAWIRSRVLAEPQRRCVDASDPPRGAAAPALGPALVVSATWML